MHSQILKKCLKALNLKAQAYLQHHIPENNQRWSFCIIIIDVFIDFGTSTFDNSLQIFDKYFARVKAVQLALFSNQSFKL